MYAPDATSPVFGGIGRLIVYLAFLLLFPGFFLYHTGVGTGLMPAVLGGFFSPVALALLPLLLACYLQRVWKDEAYFGATDLALLVYLIYFFFVVAFNYATGADYEPVREHLIAVFQTLSVFIIFRGASFGSSLEQAVSLAAVCLLSAIVLSMSSGGFFTLTDDAGAVHHTTIVTYQGFARSYLTVYIVAVAYSRVLGLRLLLHALCLPVLFLNGARSELVGAALAIALIELVRARRRLPVAAGLVVSTYLLFGAHIQQLSRMYPHNRTLELLDLSRSTSWDSRSDMNAFAWRTIAEHPLTGDYASYLNFFGPGGYAHNVLSAWVDLGLPGFIYLLLMMTVPLIVLARDFATGVDRKLPGEFALAMCLTAVSIVLVCSAKDFTYLSIPAALGAFAQYMGKRKPGVSRMDRAATSAGSRLPSIPNAIRLPQARIEKIN